MDELIAKIRELRAYLTPNRDMKERVRDRVMNAVRGEKSQTWPLFTPLFSSFFRLTAGTLAIATLFLIGFTAYLSQSPEINAYVGDMTVVEGSAKIISAPEEGKPPVVQTVEPRADRKTVRVKVKAGDVIRTSSGSTVSLNFDNSSTATVKDAAVLTVEGVTSKDSEDKPTSVAVTLEQGTIETGGATETTVEGSVLTVNTLTKSVQTSNAAVLVKVADGATQIASLEKTKEVGTLDLGKTVIIAAVEREAINTNGNGTAPNAQKASASPLPSSTPSPSGSPTFSPDPGASPNANPTPSPSGSPGTGSGKTMKKTQSEKTQTRT